MKRFRMPVLILILLPFIAPCVVSAQEITVGFTGPLSGPAAEYGQDCLNGIDLAAKEINEAGGITVKGRKYFFKLEMLDDRVDPAKSVDNAQRFRENKAIAVFNPVSATLAGILRINQEPGREFIAMGYTSSERAALQGNKLFVLNAPPLSCYCRVFADWAWSRNWRRAAILVTTGSYGDEWRNKFRKVWGRLGGNIVAEKPANYYTRTDYSEHLKTVLAAKPDVMLIGGPSVTTALVVEQARRLGYTGGFLLVDQAKMDYISQALGGLQPMENTIGTAAVQNVPLPASSAFEKKYREMYKRFVTWEAILNYSAMHALARAIAAAGTVDNVYAIRAAFPKAFPMLGDHFPTETYGIGPDGRMHMMATVSTVRNGKFTTPDLYVWWAETREEYKRVQKLTKSHLPPKRVKAYLDF